MRTIPRRYPFPAPAGERRVMCTLCSIWWYRSDCVRNAAGQLECPDCNDGGKDVATLDRERAEAAASLAATAAKPGPERW